MLQILPYWHKDRICLIGDAAHATSPALGQGANQAMQDGYLIGKYLSEEKTPSDAFQKLFKVRHPSTDKVIKGSQWSARLRSGNMWYSKIFRKGLNLLDARCDSQPCQYYFYMLFSSSNCTQYCARLRC